ncbi:BrnT family toxin [Bartonella sp. DGB2]|uniref:BrnT family toxin n=1 Tax=Bartonella sp. DGB2 TaxID=3388426 RepID=UPI00398FADD5
MKIIDFDWDGGNWPKCGKHGVSQVEIEQVLLGTPVVMKDPCPNEPRMRAIGITNDGRYVFLVFMIRETQEGTKLRPISARYMHQKEIEHYVTQKA